MGVTTRREEAPRYSHPYGNLHTGSQQQGEAEGEGAGVGEGADCSGDAGYQTRWLQLS
jgi:hypothetical protein